MNFLLEGKKMNEIKSKEDSQIDSSQAKKSDATGKGKQGQKRRNSEPPQKVGENSSNSTNKKQKVKHNQPFTPPLSTADAAQPPSSSSQKISRSQQYGNQKSSSNRMPKSSNNPKNLPVYGFEEQIIQSVRDHQVTIIVGETGSGKSTQIPQILLDRGLAIRGGQGIKKKDGAIVCTQPRRVAAVTIAQKVAEERCCAVGQEVGYSIRFEDRSSPSTKIKYVTDGVLLRECMSDPTLSRYSIIILDEAHERSLQTDILMGLIKQMQSDGVRDDLRILVMSATLQTDLFSSFFKDTNVLIVPGRQFPVSTIYSPEPEPEYVDAALSICLKIHEREEPGGVLVFLPGQEDIESLTQLLQDKLPTIHSYFAKHRIFAPSITKQTVGKTAIEENSKESEIKGEEVKAEGEGEGEAEAVLPSVIIEADGSKTIGIENLHDFVIRPLYASMPPDEQLKVFDPVPSHIRKFILATNIAETSVTISGVKYVVDTGFVKTRFINEHTGIEMLKTMPVAKSQANQRTGRAGRESAGKCFRLYPRDIFDQLPDATIPEIQRMNIAQVFLQLKALKVSDFHSFPFLSPPTPAVIRQALENLLTLGALNRDQSLTEIGEKLALLPLHPNFAYFLIKSEEFRCVQEALIAVSLLSVDNIFLQPFRDEDKAKAYQAHRVFASKDGDVITLVNIYSQWIKAKKDKKWTTRNYLSYRGLTVAENIKQQLTTLLKSKLSIDIAISCYPENKDQLLRCLCLSFSGNIAQSMQSMDMRDQQREVEREETMVANSVVRNSNKIAYSNRHNNRGPVSAALQEIQNKNTSNAPYRTLKGQQFVHIHPSSVLFSMIKNKKLPSFVIYADLLITNKQYMKFISVIEGSWLSEFFPEKFKSLTG